jgi:SAM-dependent methyltransferase
VFTMDRNAHTDHDNSAEIAAWNGPLGRSWVDWQAAFDAVLEPIGAVTLARADVRTGERVIDVGCGAGATTLELGKRVGPSGSVIGVDVSGPLLARANERRPSGLPVKFIEADATAYGFPYGEFDLLFSRFGVMFFADPTQAFANLRAALRPSGRLAFACYRDPAENPLLMTSLRAAYEHVPRLPSPGPEDPGLFSFAQEARVHRILTGAGFHRIHCEPIDLEIDIALGRGLDEAVKIGLELGPIARAMAGQPSDIRQAVAQSIRGAYAPLQRGSSVPLRAAIWLVTATSE